MADDQITIGVLGPGDEAAFEAFLMPHLASSMFLLGNVRRAGIVDTGERFSGTYVGAFGGGEMVGAVGHFWNGALMCQVPEPYTDAYLDPLWREAVRVSGRPIKGVFGPDEQAVRIQSALEMPAEIVQINHREKLYDLALADLVVPGPLASAKVGARLATQDDLETLVLWRVGYETETMGEEDTAEYRADVRQRIARLIGDGTVWVLVRDGVAVATTGFNAVLGEVVQVGGVYTPPEHRCRGYARAAVAGSLLAMREGLGPVAEGHGGIPAPATDGASRAILFTADSNIPAQKAYESLGFRQVGYFRLCLLWEGARIVSPQSRSQGPGS